MKQILCNKCHKMHKVTPPEGSRKKGIILYYTCKDKEYVAGICRTES